MGSKNHGGNQFTQVYLDVRKRAIGDLTAVNCVRRVTQGRHNCSDTVHAALLGHYIH